MNTVALGSAFQLAITALHVKGPKRLRNALAEAVDRASYNARVALTFDERGSSIGVVAVIQFPSGGVLEIYRSSRIAWGVDGMIDGSQDYTNPTGSKRDVPEGLGTWVEENLRGAVAA